MNPLQNQNTASIESLNLGSLYEPDAIGFSFQSPGWYILAGILFLVVVYFFILWARDYVKNAYRREALKNLSAIEAGIGQHKEKESLQDALVLLKIVAIQTFGREKVAPLSGSDWLGFLEERGKDTPFLKYSAAISASLYRSEEPGKKEVENIMDLSKRWIITHA